MVVVAYHTLRGAKERKCLLELREGRHGSVAFACLHRYLAGEEFNALLRNAHGTPRAVKLLRRGGYP